MAKDYPEAKELDPSLGDVKLINGFLEDSGLEPATADALLMFGVLDEGILRGRDFWAPIVECALKTIKPKGHLVVSSKVGEYHDAVKKAVADTAMEHSIGLRIVWEGQLMPESQTTTIYSRSP